MTVNDFSKLAKSSVEVRSGYNNKLLCKAYRERNHGEISGREVIAIWSEIKVTNIGYYSYSKPVLCVYVAGDIEYAAEREKQEKTND